PGVRFPIHKRNAALTINSHRGVFRSMGYAELARFKRPFRREIGISCLSRTGNGANRAPGWIYNHALVDLGVDLPCRRPHIRQTVSNSLADNRIECVVGEAHLEAPQEPFVGSSGIS